MNALTPRGLLADVSLVAFAGLNFIPVLSRETPRDRNGHRILARTSPIA